jgi:diaminopimelate epimerase
MFVRDINAQDVDGTGRALREHERFAPEGTNVSFVEPMDTSSLNLRTYERGVEAETLACGTGSVASAVVAYLEYGLRPPIRVRTHSGESLRVNFTASGDRITNVTLEGPAVIVFHGRALYDPAKGYLRGDTEASR